MMSITHDQSKHKSYVQRSVSPYGTVLHLPANFSLCLTKIGYIINLLKTTKDSLIGKSLKPLFFSFCEKAKSVSNLLIRIANSTQTCQQWRQTCSTKLIQQNLKTPALLHREAPKGKRSPGS